MRTKNDILYERVIKSRTTYECDCSKLEDRIREVCDFNARLEWLAGDGHLILNEDTSSVALMSCLEGRTKINKLSKEEHDLYCI